MSAWKAASHVTTQAWLIIGPGAIVFFPKQRDSVYVRLCAESVNEISQASFISKLI